jgi:hypothetical protein
MQAMFFIYYTPGARSRRPEIARELVRIGASGQSGLIVGLAQVANKRRRIGGSAISEENLAEQF